MNVNQLNVYGQNAISICIKNKNVFAMQLLLKKSTNLNLLVKSKENENIFHDIKSLVCMENFESIVKDIKKHIENSTKDQNKDELLKKMLSEVSNSGKTPLHGLVQEFIVKDAGLYLSTLEV